MECWLVIAAVLVIAVWIVNSQEQAKKKARAAYDAALSDLRRDPNNAQKRQTALTLGRHYSNLTRNGQGVTLFDEAAIKNDLDAATAGAARVTANPTAVQAPLVSRNPEARIRQLEELRQKGLISDEQLEARRAQILDEI